MGMYEQGMSDSPAEPVMGHPKYPPGYQNQNYDRPMPQMSSPVPVPVPPGMHHEALNNGEWATRLCACCDDCDLCCQTCWCPCVTMGQVAEIVNESNMSCFGHGMVYGVLCSVGIPCVYSFMWRRRMRYKFQLKQGPCGDFCVHCCCEPCALCQEHRELHSRGLDPSLGWELARQQMMQPMGVPNPNVMVR